MKKPRLIHNWKSCWRMFSVQMQAIAFAVLGTWQLMSEDLKTTLHPQLVQGVAMALLIAGIIGRLIDQPKVHQ